MPTTTINGLVTPSLSDPANGPSALQTLATALDTRLVARFASTAARDAAMPTPNDGYVCVVTAGKGTLWLYMASTWRAYDFGTTAYTPVWSATGGTIAIGNGSIAGTYQRMGDCCRVTIRQVMGSTSTYGTGSMAWTLPFTAANKKQSCGTIEYTDASVGQIQSGQVSIAASGAVFTFLMDLGLASGYMSRAGQAAMTMQVSDEIISDFTYLMAV